MERVSDFQILSNECLAPSVYRMVLAGDTRYITVPGQFIDIRLDRLFLRRPISVCDRDGDTVTVIYKVVGKGTKQMSGLSSGETLNVLTGLGNGYDLSRAGDRPVLVGGGVGVPPLYWLAKELRKRGKEVSVVLGFNAKEEIFYEKEMKALGCSVAVATADGSRGVRGFVTAALEDSYSHFYACGPVPMLKAVCSALSCGGSCSLEERMGCGFGACMGCSVQTKNGIKRVCKEGPVFSKEDLIW